MKIRNNPMNICLVRGVVETAPASMPHDRKTDVWLFGDKRAYTQIADQLRTADDLKTNWRVPIHDFESKNSMAAVVCPPIASGRRPALRLMERVINCNGIVAMELVVYGNLPGYTCLANALEQSISQGDGDLDDHIHIDDEQDSFLIKRSVSMNIRSPLAEWYREGLGAYETTIYGGRMDCDWLQPYDRESVLEDGYVEFDFSCSPRASLYHFSSFPSLRHII